MAGRACLVAAILLQAGAAASPEPDDEALPIVFDPAAPHTHTLAALNTRHRARLLARLALDRERAAHP